MSDLREPMRIKGMLTFFSKIYKKTPSDRIKKKGSLLLTIYFPDYSTQWIFTPCSYKENVLKCFTPDIVLNHPFLETE